jgi:molybdate transport system substrate-binding protein
MMVRWGETIIFHRLGDKKIIKRRSLSILFLLLLLGAPLFAAPTTLHIACASNFVTTLKKIMVLYAMRHQVNMVIIQGSSGALSRQLTSGLPADIFLSADKKNTQYLVDRHLASPSFAYAIGEVVLLGKSKKKYKSAKDFLTNAPHIRLGLAKPKLSPYGSRSEAILRHMGLWEKFREQIVYGENIGLAFNYFITGNATAGFIARSQLIDYEEAHGPLMSGVHYYPFADPVSHIPQYGVILKSSKEEKVANDFVNYLLHAKKAQQIIHKMGYATDI